VVFGGPFTLGQGYLSGTILEAVLPVTVRVARDVYQLPAPLALGAQPGVPFPGQPSLYYYHAVTPRPAARPLLFAGDLPIAYEHPAGLGTAVVFAGTPLGEPTPEAPLPFWQAPAWPAAAAKLILGAR